MQYLYHPTGHAIKIPNVVSGQGSYVVDEQGNRYLDLEAGVWCLSLGHNHKRVNAAINEQLRTISHTGFCYASSITDQAAGALLEQFALTGGRCIFLSSGSEAIELARSMATHLTRCRKTMTLHDSYLGAYRSLREREVDWHLVNWSGLDETKRDQPNAQECNLFGAVPSSINAFIFEPGSASGAVRFPPKRLIQELASRVRSQGGLLIANEVTTGFGRTGRWLGCDHYDLSPDIIVLGKGIGNGYPVSAVLMSRSIADALAERPLQYSQSHQNDPLGAAVVSAVLHELRQQGLVQRSRETGRRFFAWLQEMVDGKVVQDVRGRGAMFAVDLIDAERAASLHRALLDAGYIVGLRGRSLRIDPPLIVSLSEIRGFAERLAQLV